MRFAPTLPPAMYPVLDLGDYHLVQAHHLAETEGEVIDWFRERGEGNPLHVTILDNGVMERGEPDIESLDAMIAATKPSMAVCPDVWQETDETIELFNEHAQDLNNVVGTIMIVPQGKSIPEWCQCADYMIDVSNRMGLRYVVGVPKVLATFPGGRWSALAWMSEAWPSACSHLLGTWHGLAEPVQMAMWYDNVIGVDTTLPYAQALAKWMSSSHLHGKRSLVDEDWNATPDNIDEEVLWIAKINIASYRRLLAQSVVDVLSWTDLRLSATDHVPGRQLRLPLGKHRGAMR